jgi:hypothetical protein
VLHKHRLNLLFISIFVLVTTCVGVYVLYKWNKPLGSALYLPTYTESPDVKSSHRDISSLISPPPQAGEGPGVGV